MGACTEMCMEMGTRRKQRHVAWAYVCTARGTNKYLDVCVHDLCDEVEAFGAKKVESRED